VEMECSALFVTCALHGVETGAILTVDGNPLAAQDETMAGYDPHRPVVDQAVQAMLEIALDVVAQPV
jgi:uridine phosphorylase